MLSLSLLLLLVLLLPFKLRFVEERLELFLLLSGLVALWLGGAWDWTFLQSSFSKPLPLCGSLWIFGLLFEALQSPLDRVLERLQKRFDLAPLLACLSLFLSLLSILASAVLAALLLAQILRRLRLDESSRSRTAVLSCFGIGAASALSPLGGPLGAISLLRLGGSDPFFLFRVFGPYLLVLLFIFFLAQLLAKPRKEELRLGAVEAKENPPRLLFRVFKIYIFVLGLLYFGQGLNPLAQAYVNAAPAWLLYWINLLSALLDNASLAAAEFSAGMDSEKLRYAFMGLLVAGGILIPGNLPNIVVASELKIRPKEWAKSGLLYGLPLLLLFFIALRFV
jgi:predicted cation transporter